VVKEFKREEGIMKAKSMVVSISKQIYGGPPRLPFLGGVDARFVSRPLCITQQP
jgi:hypothetical protein